MIIKPHALFICGYFPVALPKGLRFMRCESAPHTHRCVTVPEKIISGNTEASGNVGSILFLLCSRNKTKYNRADILNSIS